MKVFDVPVGLEFEGHDYANFNMDAENKKINAHQERLKQWLKNNGYTGKNTGAIVRFPVADGYAQYMVAEHGSTVSLVHLTYFDAYVYPHETSLTRKQVLENARAQKAMQEWFNRSASAERGDQGAAQARPAG